ncbi:MAG: hypothetical protein Q8R78_00690 [Candidatus Omnitrophota bacterium]|nr:hypothetical protein [Candidatus Omnitrophota bacterium]
MAKHTRIRDLEMVGGPYDGRCIPDLDGYFAEGDIEAVDSTSLAACDGRWSRESVYRVECGKLVYDAELTAKRQQALEV